MFNRIATLASLACGIAMVARASGPALQVPAAGNPPTLEHFDAGAPVTSFRQRHPGDGTPATRETSAYVSYDSKNLYVLFVCKDDPAAVRAHMAKREEISNDDRVGIYLDTFNDRQRAYIFEVNPFGVQRDGTLLNGQTDPDYSFDTLWYSEGRLTDSGYVVRVSIPFKSLRFSGAPLQTWRIALSRKIVRTNEDVYWPYITDRIASFFEQMSPMQGMEGVSPGRNVQLIPYLALTRARLLDNGQGRYINQRDERGGLDSKIVLRDALTLDLTINPDFSQVESDDPQVTINKRFEVFFPEKRPFFLENATYFTTPVDLFFSRRIADPEFGARLTGKLGNWSLGALVADDRAPGELVAAKDPLYGNRALFGIGRVEYDFSKQSHFGFMSTVRNFGASSNSVFSADTRLQINRNWFFDGQLLYTDTKRLDGGRNGGTGIYADLTRTGRRFNYVARYTDFSPGMIVQAGFVPRVDIRRAEQFASYTWRPENPVLLSFGPSVSLLGNWDNKGRAQDWSVDAAFDFEFTRQTQLRFERTDSWEYYLGQGFRKQLSAVTLYSAPRKWLSFYGYYDRGTSLNYDPADGLRPFAAAADDAAFTITIRPKPRLRIDNAYIYSRLGPGSNNWLGRTPTAFNNHLARSKINYQFTRALSLRTILDYYAVLPNTDLVNLSRLKRINADVLLTYLIHPGTALYLGYTNQYQNLAPDPLNPGYLMNTASPYTPTVKQFFAKISYLFRF